MWYSVARPRSPLFSHRCSQGFPLQVPQYAYFYGEGSASMGGKLPPLTLTGADLYDENNLKNNSSTSCFLANLIRIRLKGFEGTPHESPFRGGSRLRISSSVLRGAEPDGQHNLRRFHCPDAPYQIWFKSVGYFWWRSFRFDAHRHPERDRRPPRCNLHS